MGLTRLTGVAVKAKAQEAATKGQKSATDYYRQHRSSPKPEPAASIPTSSRTSGPPPKPPPRTSISPRIPNHSPPTKFSWLDISAADKQAFFDLLDQYFSSQSQTAPQPPPPPEWARPSVSPTLTRDTPFTSFPPATTLSSSAEDFAQFFRDPSAWSNPWYASGQRLPPLLSHRDDFSYQASMSSTGNKATLIGAVLFSDLSMANYRVDYDSASLARPQGQVAILPRPQPLLHSVLEQAYQLHSEAIARFAEDAVSSGHAVGRGECWDLANAALKSLAEYDIPKVLESLSRCHGHLIYEAKADESCQQGQWRGGDTQIRRGDIVEWRRVTISERGAPAHSWSKLGDPDHTAIILADAAPTTAVENGTSLPPSSFGSLIVAEQSQGHPPKQSNYDLSRLSQGEMWVYRPIGIEAYLGRIVQPDWPAEGMRVVSFK